jgi:hypothetical protein
MTITEINVQTGKKTEREWTAKERADQASAVSIDNANKASREVSDTELAIEHLKHTMTQDQKNEALQRIRDRETGK